MMRTCTSFILDAFGSVIFASLISSHLGDFIAKMFNVVLLCEKRVGREHQDLIFKIKAFRLFNVRHNINHYPIILWGWLGSFGDLSFPLQDALIGAQVITWIICISEEGTGYQLGNFV